jgi:hypothetical protein
VGANFCQYQDKVPQLDLLIIILLAVTAVHLATTLSLLSTTISLESDCPLVEMPGKRPNSTSDKVIHVDVHNGQVDAVPQHMAVRILELLRVRLRSNGVRQRQQGS